MPLVIPCQRESWRATDVPPPDEVNELIGTLKSGMKPVEIDIAGVL
jgi:hypothetical protein